MAWIREFKNFVHFESLHKIRKGLTFVISRKDRIVMQFGGFKTLLE